MSRSTKMGLLLLVLLTFGAAAILFLADGEPMGKYAVIERNNVEIQTIVFADVTGRQTIRIEGEDGSYNIVEVEGTRIRMLEASCPDGVCVHQGWISGAATPIVCLPNRVMIEIKNDGGELDAATG